jgi:putative transposase
MEEPPPQEEEPPAQEAVIEAALPAMEEPPPQEEEPPAQDAVIEAALPATEESLDTGTPPKPDTPDGMILSVQDAVPQPSESILEPEPSPEPRFDEAEAVSPEMAAPEADRASTEPDAEPLWPPSDQTPPEEKGLEDSAPSASETHAWPFVSSQLNYRALLERGAAMPAQPNGETHCDIRYLLAWTTRSRDKILNRDIAMRTRQLIREVCVIHEAKIVRGMVAPDYVQLEVVCPPTVTPSALADDLKDRTLSVLQEEFPELKRQYWGLPLWSGGYICLSTGDNTVQDQLRAYLDAKQPMDDESFQVISAS